MRTFDLESQLHDPVSRYLKRRSYRYQASELEFYEYRIDLYAYSAPLGQSVAIELKLKKWARAVEQALVYQLCAQLVLVALPSSEIQSVDVGALAYHGLGLLAVSPNRCRQLIEPRPSDSFRADYADVYRSLLLRGS